MALCYVILFIFKINQQNFFILYLFTFHGINLIKILSSHQLLNQVTLTASHDFIYDQRPNQELFSQSSDSYLVQFSNTVSDEVFEKTQQQLKKLNLQIEISQSLNGKKMSIYTDLYPLDSQDTVTLKHQQNQVLLVDIWATWCGPCQRPMQHNQSMLQKNQEKWKNKVRIVAVSVDQQKDIIKERVESKKWNKIQHLTLLGWQHQHPLIQQFQIEGIPFVFLVNKSGQIDFAGHPTAIDLEKRINQLLEQVPEKEQQQKQESTVVVENIFSQTKKLEVLKKQLIKQKLQEKFGQLNLFSLIGTGKITITEGKLENEPLVLKLSVYEDSTESLQQFKNHLKDIDQSIYKIEENIVKFVVPPEIENSECADCKAKLQYPLYWCKWDSNPNTFRCRPCVQKKPTQQGQHYSYLQNSVLLRAPFKRIAVKNLGNNLQPKSIKHIEGPFQFSCNGCGLGSKGVGQARYICLGCRSDPNYQGDYVDVCSSCMFKYLQGSKQVKKRLEVDGHKQNHPFLRILYNVAGYYDF